MCIYTLYFVIKPGGWNSKIHPGGVDLEFLWTRPRGWKTGRPQPSCSRGGIQNICEVGRGVPLNRWSQIRPGGARGSISFSGHLSPKGSIFSARLPQRVNFYPGGDHRLGAGVPLCQEIQFSAGLPQGGDHQGSAIFHSLPSEALPRGVEF